MKLHDGTEVSFVEFGTKLGRKKFVSIELSPEEVYEAMGNISELERYLEYLMKHYKHND